MSSFNELGSEKAARAVLGTLPGVSRETLDLLETYVQELRVWQNRINLIAPSTEREIWARHVLDSAQIYGIAPTSAEIWADLGAGAGFPGLVVACLLRSRGQGRIHLIESNGKKAAFLRHIVMLLELPAILHADRIESTSSQLLDCCDVVTARALAPLDQLIAFANPLLKSHGVGLFPKGRDADTELTEAGRSWHFYSRKHPSLTASDANIVELWGISKRSQPEKP